jgi:cell division protease FtsH
MDSKRVAYHEAGHAVMSYLCGQRTFEKVTIERTDEAFGEVVITDYAMPQLKNVTSLAQHIAQLLAGTIADEILTGEYTTHMTHERLLACSIVYWNMTGEDPSEEFLQMINRPNPDLSKLQVVLKTSPELLIDLQEATRESLSYNWGAVETLARELLEKLTMNGEEVLSVLAANIEQASPRPFE